jgi:transcriptional regulator with PAS, ATPase and Fis domain
MKWIEQLDGNVIVCDADGIIIYMNETAIRNYEKDGGAGLIGKNMMDCHNEDSRVKLREMMATHQKNVYTIEKNGRKKIIYQAPWMDGDVFRGIVELSLEIPFEMPHFNRG